jgi:hypothetical protein
MDQGATQQLSIDEWQDAALQVFWDIAEQHGLPYAVTIFLTTLGVTAVETGTVGECISSMAASSEIMVQNAPRNPVTQH